MTDLLSRPAPAGTPEVVLRPAALNGALAGVVVGVVGLIVLTGLSVIGWMADASGSVTDALRFGAGAWLLSHGAVLHVTTAGVPVSIAAMPLGVTLAVVVTMIRAARWAAASSRVSDWPSVFRLAGGMVAAYLLIFAGVCLLTRSGQSILGLGRGAVGAVGVAAVGAVVGAAQADGLLASWYEGLPRSLRAGLRGGLGGAMLLVAGSALVVAGSLAWHWSAAARIVSSLQVGAAGGALLLVVCLAVLPNAILFSTSMLLGPGFALGAGTSVTATHVSLGALPAFPLLAALPGTGPTPWWAGALATLPLLAGLLAGVLAVYVSPVFGMDRAALLGGLGGLCGGLGVGLLMGLAAGGVGPGRMADIGPAALSCLVVAVVAMGLGGVVGGVCCHFVRHLRS